MYSFQEYLFWIYEAWEERWWMKLLKIFLRFFFFRSQLGSLNQEASNVMLYYLEAVVDSRKNQKDPSSNRVLPFADAGVTLESSASCTAPSSSLK